MEERPSTECSITSIDWQDNVKHSLRQVLNCPRLNVWIGLRLKVSFSWRWEFDDRVREEVTFSISIPKSGRNKGVYLIDWDGVVWRNRRRLCNRAGFCMIWAYESIVTVVHYTSCQSSNSNLLQIIQRISHMKKWTKIKPRCLIYRSRTQRSSSSSLPR